MTPQQRQMPNAAGVVHALRGTGTTLAVAESVTGGLLAAALTDVPGASACFRGGVVAYATELKARLLGVDPGLLAQRGPVCADVAAAMARGVCRALSSTWGLGVTGVAGPVRQDQVPVGTVFVGLHGPGVNEVAELHLSGDRNEIRQQAVTAALVVLAGQLGVSGMLPNG